jgi:hypothetical protein
MKTVVAFVMVSSMWLAACGPKAQTTPAATPAAAHCPLRRDPGWRPPSVISVGELGPLRTYVRVKSRQSLSLRVAGSFFFFNLPMRSHRGSYARLSGQPDSVRPPGHDDHVNRLLSIPIFTTTMPDAVRANGHRHGRCFRPFR